MGRRLRLDWQTLSWPKSVTPAQQTSEAVIPHRPDNLFAPVEGDYSAQGSFDDRAATFSLQNTLNLSPFRGVLAFAGAAAVAGIAFAGIKKGQRG